MNLTDRTLQEALATLTPAERRAVSESLKEGAAMPEDVRAILRWLRRRLKRKARSKRNGGNFQWFK